jgi:hypothetical protein
MILGKNKRIFIIVQKVIGMKKILAGAGFYPIFDFHQKYYINPPCLIGDDKNPQITGISNIGVSKDPRRAG